MAICRKEDVCMNISYKMMEGSFEEIQKHYKELDSNPMYNKMVQLSELACDLFDYVSIEKDIKPNEALEIVKIAVMMEYSEKQKQLIDQMELLRHQLLERGLS